MSALRLALKALDVAGRLVVIAFILLLTIPLAFLVWIAQRDEKREAR